MKTNSYEAFAQVLAFVVKYFKRVVVAAAVLVLLSGVYQVEGNEVAVVLRFGRLAGATQEERIKKPGLHVSFPFFIDEVITVPVQTVREREIVTHYGTEGGISADIDQNGYVLTGDHHVVLIKAKIKYQIGDAIQYALFCRNVESALDGIVSGEMTRLITQMGVDSVLTSGKAELSSQAKRNAQRTLDELKTGIVMADLEVTEIVPPSETKEYFDAVIDAAVDKETSIQQAKEYAAVTLLDAEAEARACKQDAIYEQTIRLTKARKEMAEFLGLYDQYTRNAQIVVNGAFRERVSRLLSRMGSVIIVPEGGAPTLLLP